MNTSDICSSEGAVASHSRMRAVRSPEVGAEKAPPVRASKGWAEADLDGAGEFTADSGALDWGADFRREKSDMEEYG